MSSRLQTDIVRALLEAKGLAVNTEVKLGEGLWKGIRADFVAENVPPSQGRPPYRELAIECKWQESPGSTSEKLAYLVLNVQRHYPIPCLILCSGPELEAPRAWAKRQVDGSKLVAVLSTDEFIAWVGSL